MCRVISGRMLDIASIILCRLWTPFCFSEECIQTTDLVCGVGVQVSIQFLVWLLHLFFGRCDLEVSHRFWQNLSTKFGGFSTLIFSSLPFLTFQHYGCLKLLLRLKTLKSITSPRPFPSSKSWFPSRISLPFDHSPQAPDNWFLYFVQSLRVHSCHL